LASPFLTKVKRPSFLRFLFLEILKKKEEGIMN
jgi:hypothetical protein